MSDGRQSGRMSDDGDGEFHSVVDTMEAVASYWAREKNRLALGHLERKVFSWSIRDIFNRDLLRHQVTSIKHRFIVFFFCLIWLRAFLY
jgi:senataxin